MITNNKSYFDKIEKGVNNRNLISHRRVRMYYIYQKYGSSDISSDTAVMQCIQS